MKLLILLFLISSSLFSFTINESLLKIHATLVPKLYLMDYKFQDKLKENTISIALVYNENEYHDARDLQRMINSRYKNGIKTYKVKAILVTYKKISSINANVYYLFPANKKEVQHVISKANLNNALTFAYLKDDLKYGVMISLNISKKIKPLLNLEAIKRHNIALRPVLIDISTIYLKASQSKEFLKIRSFYNSDIRRA